MSILYSIPPISSEDDTLLANVSYLTDLETYPTVISLLTTGKETKNRSFADNYVFFLTGSRNDTGMFDTLILSSSIFQILTQ